MTFHDLTGMDRYGEGAMAGDLAEDIWLAENEAVSILAN